MRPVAVFTSRRTAVHRTVAIAFAVLLSVIPLSLGETSSQGDGDVALRDYLSGNGLLNRGLYELAAAEYRKFLADHGEHEKAAVARYGLGVSLFRLGQFEQAAAELSPLLKRAEFVYAAETWTIVGQCHAARGRHAGAAETFNTVVQRFGKHDLADDAALGEIEALYADKRYADALARCVGFETQWPESSLRERTAYFAALSAMGKGDHAGAAVRFDRILRDYPQGPFSEQAVFLLAQCHQQNHETDKAIQQYRRVLKRKDHPYAEQSLAALGTILLQEGKYPEAGESLDQLIERFPQSPLLPQARLHRARAWYEQGQFERAAGLFGELAGEKNDFSDQAAYWTAKSQLRLGDAAGAAARLKSAIEQFPESSLLPEMSYDRAVALLRSGDTDAATAALEQFRARFSGHELAPDALQMSAFAEHQLAHYDRSQVHVHEFLGQYPTHVLAATMTFLSCENDFLSGKYAEAVEGYRRLLKEHPDDPQATKAKFRLATALYRLQRFDEAEPLLVELASTASQDELYRPVLLALGDIYFQRGEWKLSDQRLNEYLRTTTQVPSMDDALLKLGLARERQGKIEEALRTFDRLIEGFPQSPHRVQAIFERGQALVERKQFDEAAKAFESVLAEGGDSRFVPHALNHLAAIAVQRNDLQKAAALYARVAQSSAGADTEADALFQQGQTLMGAQKFAEAEMAYARFVERFGEHPKAGEVNARMAVAIARQDRHADAVSAIERLESNPSMKLEPSLRVTLSYEKAWCYRALGKLDEAAKAYREVLGRPEAGPLKLHAMLELAEIESGAKRYDAAAQILRELRKKLADRSEDAPAELTELCTYRAGVCEFELERFEEAATIFEEFIASFPQSTLLASASYYCGDSWFRLGRHERAVPHLTRVVKDFEADPAAPMGLLRLGECQALLQRWSASEQTFAAYLDRFPEGELWFQAQFGLGWARENQKRFEEAVAAYQAVVRRHQGPTAARAQFQIGQCLFAEQKYEDAVRELLKVDILYSYPEWSAAALYEAARCFEKTGKTVEAKKHFQQVEEKHKHTQWAGLAAQRLSELASNPSLPGR